MDDNKQKIYLGDGVYVEVGDRCLILTAEDGYRATDTIYLEKSVVEALLNFIKKYHE